MSNAYKLAQLKANKSPLLQSYLHTGNPDTYKSQWPLCFTQAHDTNHPSVTVVKYEHNTSLWKNPLEAEEVV